jgi:CBS domain-containing protein
MLVAHILNEKGRDVVSIRPEATLQDAAAVLTRHRIGALIVRGEAGALMGIISERDIVRAVAELGQAGLAQQVSTRMTSNVAVCDESGTIAEIMETMTRFRFRHLPVVRDGKVCGIISIGDVVKSRIYETTCEAEALKEYIATA